MTVATNAERRRFLIGSVSVAGGVAFGVVSPWKRAMGETPVGPAGQTPLAITPFVEIGAAGITLVAPRADMGQGIASTQAYLIAEELDVDPLKCTISTGFPDPIYYNAAVADSLAPFPEYDHSEAAEQARKAGQEGFRQAGLQVTGGSTSVPDMFDRLRSTGASAREALKLAAAQEHGVAPGQLSTEDGHVILPSGKRVPYEALARRALTVTLPETVSLRSPREWRYLGKAVMRTDIVAKSTGTQVYGIDAQADDMLYATVRTHPAWGGEMLSFDASRAEAMPGVKRIVPLENGVAVVADRTWRAFKAMDAITFEWGKGTFPKSDSALWEALENGEQAEFLEGQLRNDGDVDAVLANPGGQTLEAEYRVPYLAHAPLEPMNAMVRVTDDQVDVWTGTQIPGFVQAHVAAIVGMPAEQVIVHNHVMGGSFGRRLEDEHVKQAAQIALAVKDVPVKMTWTREEDMSHDFPRPAQLGRLRGRIQDGKIHAYDVTTIGSSAVRSWLGRVAEAPPKPDVLQMAGAWDQPYRIPNYRVTGYAPEGLVPTTTHRCPGANANGFFHDAFLDEMLHEAGQDPLEGRIALCHHEASRKVLEAVGELCNWDGVNIGAGRGRGVAFVLSHGVPAAEVVDVTVTENGIRIDEVYVAVDSGAVLDPANFEAQVTGGVVWGLGHAINAELTYEDYAPTQTNFHAYECLRMYQTPRIQYVALSNNFKIRGIGEPTVAPAAPALANALFAATGKRYRELPLGKHLNFV